ncbi:condensation domain-containing protein [Xylaria acuta]|nr:condensation domain-containing protein [Xylaria acuta]
MYLDGPLGVVKFKRAIKVVGQRHEALRTRFKENQEITQEIIETPTFNLEIRDVSDSDGIARAYNEIKCYDFKSEERQIMRILLRQSATSSNLIIVYHHINMDGLSLETTL